jgi:hypothetical protein
MTVVWAALLILPMMRLGGEIFQPGWLSSFQPPDRFDPDQGTILAI